MNHLKHHWTQLSRGDRIALLLAEAAVIAGCVWLLPLSQFTRADWQTEVVVVGLVVAFLQGVVALVVMVIASQRRKATATLPHSPNAKKSGFGSALVLWLMLGVLYVVGGYVADWMFPYREWAAKWHYGLSTDLKDAAYVFAKQPHDCEFLSAPLGDKHCHYDRVVATIRVRRGQSGREVSYDDGETWSRTEPSVQPAVLVSWTKVEE